MLLIKIIHQDVNKLWEKAVQELDRDEQLVKFMVEKEQKQGAGRQRAFSANSYYDSVAIPEARNEHHAKLFLHHRFLREKFTLERHFLTFLGDTI